MAVRLRITGHVQGVFFRMKTREMADILGVKGWVRNEADGSVAAHIEGDADKVEKLVAWCNVGSPAAHVDTVERTEVPDEHLPTFESIRG